MRNILSFRLRTPLAATALLIALVACGGSESPSTSYTVPVDADLVVKAVPAIRWDQTEYTAPAGEISVFLANDDNVKHILVILEGNKVVGDLELVVTKKGDVDQGVITLEPGEYRVYCTIPGHGGMNSLLTVS